MTPIRRSISVSWSQDEAYRRFTTDFAKWWPSYSLSIGGKRVERVVFEAREGGRIFEEHHDGTRFLWGTVTALEPPRRVAFTFHSSRAASDAQSVEVTFDPDGDETRVTLVATGWEKMSDKAKRAHSGFEMSWKAALDAYADRSSGMLLFFKVMSFTIDVLRQRGSFIRHSLSRMPARSGTTPE